MEPWLQHLLVLLLVAGCFGYVVWQGGKTLFGRKGKVGSCCSRGCPEPASTAPRPGAERIVFMPVEMLSKRR